ncbi:hypothetical protein B296_00051277 [Ensete ventricosum]|uniref:Uncharacterized protein n=1 Tax=Ensete ventricosum TaxID=4639 RepID=A0A426XT81_ENSVE|nr:hypothetical protein B296_00051277 [Ensete ventricosum]
MTKRLLQSRLAKVKSMHRVDAVGNSPRVHRELAEGIESLPGWRKGVHQKKTETHQKIVGGSQEAYREFGRCSGISSEFARRFVEVIGKLAGNMSGDYWKKTIGLAARMSEVAGLAGVRS